MANTIKHGKTAYVTGRYNEESIHLESDILEYTRETTLTRYFSVLSLKKPLIQFGISSVEMQMYNTNKGHYQVLGKGSLVKVTFE